MYYKIVKFLRSPDFNIFFFFVIYIQDIQCLCRQSMYMLLFKAVFPFIVKELKNKYLKKTNYALHQICILFNKKNELVGLSLHGFLKISAKSLPWKKSPDYCQ